eukprot:CAMPEP_0201565890 /NCGR_PEP_ID=MMETSP0190_2-20130828/5314_1 /ASSEMBLY_ACC=CAM_ASM_000263 /TAXON_ID=37353 /ORGANISM="Rosalina sp." /LENGTH=312 /DNA_ID=CAMNT_0047983903 /DNA_START=115 /DNA_END=1053 /DNA_ORIENTATION=+
MSSKNPQADYDQALALKDAGNAAFKSGDFKGALKNYSRIFMHIGMNPCMNMSQMMGGGGAPPAQNQQSKDPLQQKTDGLRLTAFNNMAAVYAKMGKWDDCKDKCTRVLKHDDKNTKALFRRGMAQRKLNLYELARADLEKAKEIKGTKDPAIERELKLLSKDEKNADKEFYAKMKKQMQRAKKKKAKKKAEKKEAKKKAKEEEAKKDDNPNLKANVKDDNDDAFMWDVPATNDNDNKPKDDKNKEASTTSKDNKGGDKDKDKGNDDSKKDTKDQVTTEPKKDKASTTTEDKPKDNKDKTSSDKTSPEQPSEF